MMNNYTKFEGIDYANTFARRINSVHQLVSKNLKAIVQNNNKIIDVGGGPGIGAMLIDELEKNCMVLNIEPSDNVNVVPEFKHISYDAIQFSFKDALSAIFPWEADIVLMISAAHEIALSYGKSNAENKAKFFEELKQFLKTNAKSNALFCIGFPNYKANVSQADIAAQRNFVNALLGHSHPPQENFYIEEFEKAFNAKPLVFEQKPMVLADETEEETKLMANFAAFTVKDIIGKR